MTAPPAAITAALNRADELGYTAITTKSVTALLEAAAPWIVADVLARVEQGIADGAAEVITQAVTAERDRIRQLAIDENAWYGADPECLATDKEGDCPHCDPRSFADLLRGDQ